MSVLKFPFFVHLQQKVGELFLSVSFCPSIIILENTLNQCIENCGFCNFNQQHNVSSLHLHAFLDVGNFTKVVHACSDLV
jgi:hypothetical protein